MTEIEIARERRKILRDPAGYFTGHEAVDKAYKNKVIDKLTAESIHARLDGISYGNYKGKEYLANGKKDKVKKGSADTRRFRPYRVVKNRGRYKPFTDAERMQMKKMYLVEGASTANIADLFGVSKTTIASYLHEMGVVMNKHIGKRMAE